MISLNLVICYLLMSCIGASLWDAPIYSHVIRKTYSFSLDLVIENVIHSSVLLLLSSELYFRRGNLHVLCDHGET